MSEKWLKVIFKKSCEKLIIKYFNNEKVIILVRVVILEIFDQLIYVYC